MIPQQKQQVFATVNELEQQPVTLKLMKITSPMDFQFLTAKASEQIQLVHVISAFTFLQP